MCKQFYECDTCKNSIKGHVFFPERADNGETVWVCHSCGETRGFCSHEVETDSFDYYSHGTGCPETITFHYCPHCHEDLDLSWQDEKGKEALAAATATKPDPILDDPACPDPLTQPKEYREYLAGVLDPRD